MEAEGLERELVRAGFTQDHDMQKICLKKNNKVSEIVRMRYLRLDCHILVCILQENPTKAENGASKKGQARDGQGLNANEVL